MEPESGISYEAVLLCALGAGVAGPNFKGSFLFRSHRTIHKDLDAKENSLSSARRPNDCCENADAIYKTGLTQKSSDLSAIDLFLGYGCKYHAVSAFRLNRLHAKIYIIDDQEMFITSSNLTYSGLIANFEIAVHVRESADVNEVRAVLDRQMHPESQISLPDITEMVRDLQLELRTLTAEGVIQEWEREEEKPLESETHSLIGQDDEETAPIEEEPTAAAKRLGTLNEINEYISRRGIATLNQIGGDTFESVARPTAPSMEESESERAKFIEEWSSKAKRDEGRIEAHLRSLFGKYFPAEWDRWEEFVHIFTHASWLSLYRREEFPEIEATHFRYGQLGNDLRNFLSICLAY